MSEPLAEIKRKCEQYWNERGICDEEVHSILEFIHSRACNLERQGVSQTQEPISDARTTAPNMPDPLTRIADVLEAWAGGHFNYYPPRERQDGREQQSD